MNIVGSNIVYQGAFGDRIVGAVDQINANGTYEVRPLYMLGEDSIPEPLPERVPCQRVNISPGTVERRPIPDAFEVQPEDVPMLRQAVARFIGSAGGAELAACGGLEAWDALASALTRSDPATTLAERFCADPDANAYEAPYCGEDTYSFDAGTKGGGPTNEVRFADGSFACSVEAGGYEARRLTDEEKAAGADEAAELTVERFYNPKGWLVAEGA